MSTKTKLQLSIIPTYQCNYHCSYCYLGNLTLSQDILDLNILKERINELSLDYDIEHICVYGGEISLLDKSYIDNLMSIINKFDISFVTNLSQEWIIDYSIINDITLCVSLNEERPNYHETLEKLYKLKGFKNIKLSVVVLPSLLKENVKKTFELYKNLGFDILFIQYHPSKFSNKIYNIENNDFIEFVLKMCNENKNQGYPINIDNEIIFDDDTYSPTMDKFLFISPNGKYSSVGYENNIENQLFFDSLDEWKKYCLNEFQDYYNKCHNCQLFNKCKAEHLIQIGDKNNCSGFYNYFIKNSFLK